MFSAQFKKIVFFLFLSLGFSLIWKPGLVMAADSCTASVSPSSVQTNSGTSFSFSLTNTGTSPIVFIKIVRPSSNFTLENRGVTGWSITANSSQAELSNGSIATGDTFNFSYYALAGSSEAASANWQVSASTGGGLVGCTGSLGTAISGATDVTGPVISGIVVSGVNDSSGTISWTTDEASSSVIDYSSDDGGSGSTNGNSNTTSHSVTLSGLSASTVYYYYACSTDGLNNRSCSSQGSFTTSATGTIAPTSTPAPAVPTPTPTPSIDRTPPRVIIKTNVDEPFEAAPLIEGRATDNKDIDSVEYSTDGGSNWLPVDEIENEGSSKTDFEFIPFLNEDGNYSIQVRAKDNLGNTGTSKEITLVIDRLPPLMGGNLISMGPQPLTPNADGTVVALAGLEQKITMSAVGGPIAIDLFVGEKKIPLEYSPETSLWSGFLNLDEVGTYTLTAKAIDGADNKTTRELNPIQVIGAGKMIDQETGQAITKGKISIFTQNTQTQLWNLWDGKAFSQENPQSLDNGTYQFFLPPGTYYLQIKSAGFQTLKTQIFTLDESQPINTNFMAEEGRVIKLGPFKIRLPAFLQKTLEIDLSLSETKSQTTATPTSSSLVNQIAPGFSLSAGENQFQLSSLRGETSIVSFVSTWSPPAVEQISIINKLVETELAPIVMVSTQETASKVTIFNQRGNYQTPIWVDPDGELVEKYQLTTLPTHFILDRRGQVDQIITQVLNKDQLLTLLSNPN